MGMKNDSAFTLSEVLITLAIIAVVAAMTMPTLIKNYKKLDTVTKLKKAYTTINQALKLSEAENGEYKFWENGSDLGTEEYLNKYWLPYFNVYKLCTSYSVCGYTKNNPFKTLSGNSTDWGLSKIKLRIPFIATDNILYNISVSGGDEEKGYNDNSWIYIDINGSKEPNVFGKDYFWFIRTEDKGILPYGYDLSTSEIDLSCSKSGNGYYCAEKIRRAGWKIEDDYPW